MRYRRVALLVLLVTAIATGGRASAGLLAPIIPPGPPVDEAMVRWFAGLSAVRGGLLNGAGKAREPSLVGATRVADCFSLGPPSPPPCKPSTDPDDPLVVPGSISMLGTTKQPDRYEFVYDPVHRLALFRRGCCGFDETALVSDVPPPPDPVMTNDLSRLQTRSGIRLGARHGTVARIFGRPKRTVRGSNRRLTAYFYEHQLDRSCDQVSSFVFDGRKLVAISFWNGC
ncbi:MAG: hypothetical protein ACREM6_03815 [Vulcanimicrobiaceae bacterium]